MPPSSAAPDDDRYRHRRRRARELASEIVNVMKCAAKPAAFEGGTMLIETDDGFIPLQRIVRASRKDKEGNMRITYEEGGNVETAVATAGAWEIATQSGGRFFSAAPGTYLLHEVDGGDDWECCRSVVIGWTMTADGLVYPVTGDGVNDGCDGNIPILHPDGRVQVPQMTTFDTFEEWEKRARERWAA